MKLDINDYLGHPDDNPPDAIELHGLTLRKAVREAFVADVRRRFANPDHPVHAAYVEAACAIADDLARGAVMMFADGYAEGYADGRESGDDEDGEE